MINKKVAIITGAAKGIGRETAIRFAQEGYYLTLVDIEDQSLEELRSLISKEYGVEAITCVGDLALESFLNLIIFYTISKWGRVDVLVNNAAWRTIETMRSISMQTWNQTMQICLTAPAFLSQLAADSMEKNKAGGVIVNVSSMMSDRPAGISPAYIAAKGALESLTKELAVTYGRSGIRVVCVKPGFIDTDLSKDYKSTNGEELSDVLAEYLIDATPLKSPASPVNVADAILFLCSDQAGFITGTSLTIDGGFTGNMNSYQLKKRQFPKEY